MGRKGEGHGRAGLAAAALAATLLAAQVPRVLADGAIAMGTTGDVVRHGVAFGLVANEPKEKAADLALTRCRAFVKGSSPQATAQCKVVATFSRDCFAVAYDPQPGTPGYGWGVGPTQLAANLKAIAMCEQTAGPTRRRFCQVESGACDTQN
jgi:hypothetical protein